jgi:hypothetical protein
MDKPVGCRGVPVRLCDYVYVYKHDLTNDGIAFMEATANPGRDRRPFPCFGSPGTIRFLMATRRLAWQTLTMFLAPNRECLARATARRTHAGSRPGPCGPLPRSHSREAGASKPAPPALLIGRSPAWSSARGACRLGLSRITGSRRAARLSAMSPVELVLAVSGASLVGGVVGSISGMGGGIIIVPVLSVFFGMRSTMPSGPASSRSSAPPAGPGPMSAPMLSPGGSAWAARTTTIT